MYAAYDCCTVHKLIYSVMFVCVTQALASLVGMIKTIKLVHYKFAALFYELYNFSVCWMLFCDCLN